MVVDSVVLRLARSGVLTPASGRVDPDRIGGILLTEKARRALIAGIENRLLTVFRHHSSAGRVSYRRSIHLQAAAMVRVIRSSGDEGYRPVLSR